MNISSLGVSREISSSIFVSVILKLRCCGFDKLSLFFGAVGVGNELMGRRVEARLESTREGRSPAA